MQTIVIDPVTRIEGHAKITIHLDESGDLGFNFTKPYRSGGSILSPKIQLVRLFFDS